MRAAIFLDRDGTIVEDTGYVHKVEDFKLLPNAVGGLKKLKKFMIFVVTNQSGIGRGIYKLNDFNDFNEKVIDELKKHKIKIEKIYFCPHKPEDNCECRKPKTKHLLEASKEFQIDLGKSYVIGDMKADFFLAKNAGCRTIHLLTGMGQSHRSEVNPDYTATDLLDAAEWILKQED